MVNREVTQRDSGLYETCARHSSRQTTRALQSIYLCDSCAGRLIKEAFNDRNPVFHGQTIVGYCGLCSENQEVTHRMWFVCPICWNVILAYQKSIAASKAIHAWWTNSISPQHPNLLLDETEPVYLSPFLKGSRTKRQGAEAIEVLDFLVTDKTAIEGVALFHIEQKTGPGSINEMKEFQLDVNDFNDIAGAVNNTKVPSYVFHVQARQEYTFPTYRTVVLGLWWTDIVRLQAHQRRIATRRGEDKKAIYYDPRAFQPIETFATELWNRRYLELAARILEEPIALIG